MPPAKASAKAASSKRKAEPDESASDTEADSKAARVEQVDEVQSADDFAKSMFLSSASVPCPEAKHSSGGGGSVSVEGVVTRCSEIKVQGKSGMVPKIMVTVLVNKIAASGNSPIITTGIDGVAFGLPTRQLEASPEEIAKDANAKGPLVIDIGADGNRASYLGVISTSFYTDPANSKQGKKGGSSVGEAPSVASCTPGTRVLVSGVSSTFGKVDKEGRTPLYTNAKKIQPISATVAPGMVAKNIINEFCSPAFQKTSSFLLSSYMHGFFGVKYDRPELAEQAEVFKNRWDAFCSNAAVKCDAIAAMHTGEDAATIGNALAAHAARIRAISPHDAAQGAHIFNVDLPKDCVTPYVAPIVQHGVKPGAVMGGFVEALFDSKRRASLPPTFSDSLVSNVTFKGNLIQVDYRVFFVGDSEKASAAVAYRVGNPVLDSTRVAASVKLSKRSFGPEVLGTLVSSKIEMLIKEIMYTMDHGAIANVFPRSADSISVEGHFTPTVGYDMVDGISKVGIIVSQEWINTNMLGGRGVLIHKHADDAELVDPVTGAGPSPTLSKNFYQAVSEGSFDFDSLTPPDGLTTKFYVVYDGCSTNVKNAPTINTSVDEGERHMADIVPTARDDGDIKAFLRNDAVVYAIAE
jgi:hypothetical protein